jgi:hypothetical protein
MLKIFVGEPFCHFVVIFLGLPAALVNADEYSMMLTVR